MASSLEVADAAAEAMATAPRVSLASMKEKITNQFEFVAGEVLAGDQPGRDVPESLKVLSICVLVMKNGFTVIGKAAPASEENFNRALGKQFAYEDAIRQLWPLEGYALRERLNG